MATRMLSNGVPVAREGVTFSRVIELVDSRRQDSLRYNHRLFSKLLQYYNTYRGIWQGRIAQFRNNVSIPFTFAMIQRDVAQKVQSSFGSWPIVTFEGYAPEDESLARKRTTLISAQMRDARSIVKAADFFLQSDICGTGIARVGWKSEERKRRTRSLESVGPSLQIPVVRDGKVRTFYGPDWDTVDRLDFWQQPAVRDIHSMAWVIHRYWKDLDDLREDAQSERPYFDPTAVGMLDRVAMGGNATEEFMQRRLAYRNEFDYMARQRERFAKPVEIWEMHGLVPAEFAPDGIRDRCIAIANGRVVLRNRPAELPIKPFLSYAPMPDPYGFDGIGKAEVAYGPQRTADRLANQKLDALDLIIDPMWVASSSANINTQHLFSRAGRVLLVDGAADDANIRPLAPDMRGFQAAYGEINTLYQYMQLGTGVNDIIQGGAPQERETARGFLGRQENTLTRLSLEGLLAEVGMVEPLADAFVELDRLYLPLPYQTRIMGSMASTDPYTGLPYPPERVTIGYGDLVPDYAARAVGASQAMGKAARQQNWVGLAQIMSSNPALLQLVNWANFARETFDLFGFKNVNDLLVNQVPMVNQIAAQQGQSPEQTAQQVSQPLDQLSPDIIGSLLGGQGSSPIAMVSQ